MITNARITPRGEDRLRAGHPWIYRSDVRDVEGEPGPVVRVLGHQDRPLGHALFSNQSQIVLRVISRGDVVIDEAFWRGRLKSAIDFRASLGERHRVPARPWRSGLLPSLIVDKYGDYLVLQALSQGMDTLLPTLIRLLVELTGAKGVLGRNDPKVRLLEGLEQKVELLYGEVPPPSP